MSYQMPPEREREDERSSSIATAIQEITEKAQLLVREEIELARTELEIKAKALGTGAAIGAAAGVFVLAALLMILHGLAWLAWYVLPLGNADFFWGFFFVAGVLLVLAVIAGLVARRFLKRGTPPTPVMAIDEGRRIQQTVTEARSAEVQR